MDYGFVEVAGSNQSVFDNTLESDLLMYTLSPAQSIRMGAGQGGLTPVSITKTAMAMCNMKLSLNNSTMCNNNGQLVISGTVNMLNDLRLQGDLYQGDLKSKAWYVGAANSVYQNVRVGINTTNPAYSLHVLGQVNIDGSYYENGVESRLLAKGQADNTMFSYTTLGLGNSNPDTQFFGDMSNLNVRGLYQQEVPSYAFFYDSNTGSIFYTSNVGINTDNPLFDLDVAGDINVRSNLFHDSVACRAFFYDSNTGSVFYTSNVGIGTSNPEYSLDIDGTTNFDGTIYQSGIASVAAYVSTNGHAYFPTRLGIATNTPAYNLDVNGSLNLQSLHQDGVASTALWNGMDGALYYDSNIGVFTSTPSNAIEAVGRIAAHESMFTPLLALGNEENTIQTQTDNLVIDASTGGHLVLKNGLSNVLYVAPSAMVGIFTPAPQGMLHVCASNGDTEPPPLGIFENTSGIAALQVRGESGCKLELTVSQDDVAVIRNTSASGTVSVMNSGSGGVTVTAASRVGVNTTTPSTPFEIYNGTARINSSNTTNTVEVFLTHAGGTNSSLVSVGMASKNQHLSASACNGDAVVSVNSTNGKARIHFQNGSNNTTAITINSNNYVGIGTAAASQLLEVAGNALFKTNVYIGDTNTAIYKDTTTGSLVLSNDGSVSLMADGFDFDTSTFDIQGTGYNGNIRFANFDETTVGIWGVEPYNPDPTGMTFCNVFGGGTSTDTPLVLYTACNERLRITHTGHIGIGTETPNAPLEFSASNQLRKVVLLADSNNNNYQFYGLGCSNDKVVYNVAGCNQQYAHVFSAGTTSTTSQELLRIDGTGRVGIASSNPVGTLHMRSIKAGSELSNNIVIDVGRGSQGVSYIGFNGYDDPLTSTPSVINPPYSAWRMCCTQNSNLQLYTDSLVVDQYSAGKRFEYMKFTNSNIIMRQYVRLFCPDTFSEIQMNDQTIPISLITANSNIMNTRFMLALAQDSAYKPGSGNWATASDERIKNNITIANIDSCYDMVKNIPLKQYELLNIGGTPSQRRRLGWIAQDVELHLPNSVTKENMHGFEDFRTLDPDQLYASMYGCIQKLQNLVEALAKRVDELELGQSRSR